jgi:hypothetical protein
MWKAIGVCIIILLLASCTRDTAYYNPCPSCPSNISFRTAIIPIFTANCSTVGCHNATTDAFSLNLDSAHAYAAATEPGTGNVSPGNAEGSLLYTILLGTAGSHHMPLDAPPLSPCEIQDIGCWINQGALNN